MDSAAAETVALQALAYLVSEEEALQGFLAQTGATADDLRRGAGTPQFLGGVLDFLLERDDRLLAFCDQVGVTPAQTQRARAALPGATPPM